MDDRDLDINVSDTESSASGSSSSVGEGLFKTHIPFVLELHDIRKDDPLMPGMKPIDSLGVGPGVTKIRKHKKKKKGPVLIDTSHTSLSTDSQSDASSVAPSSTDVKEEFYDAHESYHAIPENQIPVALATKLIGQSESNQNPKAPELTTSSEPQSTSPATHSETTPIIKPTAPP